MEVLQAQWATDIHHGQIRSDKVSVVGNSEFKVQGLGFRVSGLAPHGLGGFWKPGQLWVCLRLFAADVVDVSGSRHVIIMEKGLGLGV